MKKLFLVLLAVVMMANTVCLGEAQGVAIDSPIAVDAPAKAQIDLSGMSLDELKKLKDEIEKAIIQASVEDIDGYIVMNDYAEYARNPDYHIGEMIRFNGTVVQVIEGIEYNHYRVAVNGNSNNIFYVTYTPSEGSERILEDDLVTVFGVFDGLYTYETVMGSEVTIPYCTAENITDQVAIEGEYAATRSDPAPIGATVRYDGSSYSNEAITDFTITKVIKGDSAWQMIRKFNRYNDAPASNQEYIVVYIKANAISSENDQQAEIDSYDFTLVSASGMEYQKAYVSGATPELTNLYPGAEHEGVYVGLVEKGDAPLLVYLKSSDRPLWFDLNKRAPITLPDDIVLNTLARGSKGEEVQNMQAALVEMGYLNGNPDGDFGGITEAAVIAYQQAMGIEATGIADEATLRLILTYTTP